MALDQYVRLGNNLHLMNEHAMSCSEKNLTSTSMYMDLLDGGFHLCTHGVVYKTNKYRSFNVTFIFIFLFDGIK